MCRSAAATAAASPARLAQQTVQQQSSSGRSGGGITATRLGASWGHLVSQSTSVRRGWVGDSPRRTPRSGRATPAAHEARAGRRVGRARGVQHYPVCRGAIFSHHSVQSSVITRCSRR